MRPISFHQTTRNQSFAPFGQPVHMLSLLCSLLLIQQSVNAHPFHSLINHHPFVPSTGSNDSDILVSIRVQRSYSSGQCTVQSILQVPLDGLEAPKASNARIETNPSVRHDELSHSHLSHTATSDEEFHWIKSEIMYVQFSSTFGQMSSDIQTVLGTECRYIGFESQSVLEPRHVRESGQVFIAEEGVSAIDGGQEVRKLIDNGPPENRIDVVLMVSPSILSIHSSFTHS